mgnify:FL=1
MKTILKILSPIIYFIIFSCSTEKLDSPFKVSSPNNSLTATVSLDGGLPYYSLTFNGTPIVDRSRLGIKTDKLIFSDQLEVTKVKRRSKDKSWKQVWGEQKIIRDNHNELEITLLCKVEKNKMILRFRIFDDGIGFRYEIPRQNQLSEFTILDELTEFNLSEDSPSWWIPAYAYRRYEFLYAKTRISEISRDKFSELVENLNGARIGPEAVQTPFTTQRKDGTVITIHEANLANYSSMALKATGTKNLECDLFPWSDGTKVKTSAPMKSPWRTIIVGGTPSDVVMSTLTLNLNEPNKLSNTSWIEPGKYIGVWWEMIGTNQSTWGSGPHHGATTEKVMKYIDFGSEHGFDGVLVEGWNKGWDQNWCCNGEGEDFGFYHPHPEFDHKLVRNYAKEKNIRIVGHHETGTQIENYESQLDSAFAYCKRNGIRVVKTGYVNDGSKNIKRTGADGKIYKEWHHGQYMVEHFRKVLETAAKYEVSIVVHEPIKDTGLRRTYPNMVSREGARGQEFNGFMGINDNNKPNHTTILPFTRLISSPMDYTPGIFNLMEYRYFAPDNRKINLNHHIPSTISKELALYVVIYAPVQMAADLPENYEGHPAFQFIKDVPTDWEHSICVNGEIGEYITMARKDIASDDWYLGSISNEKSRELRISLSFLDSDKKYNATVYRDPESGGWKKRPEEVVIENRYVTSKTELEIVLPKGGGQAIRFSPEG